MPYYIACIELQLIVNNSNNSNNSNDYFDLHKVMDDCGFTNSMIDDESYKQCPLPFNTYFFDEQHPRNVSRFQTLDEVRETLGKALEKLKHESGRYVSDNHTPSSCFIAKIDASDISKKFAYIFSI